MRNEEDKQEAMKQVWVEFFEKKLPQDYDGVIEIPERFDMVTEFVTYMCALTVVAVKGTKQ